MTHFYPGFAPWWLDEMWPVEIAEYVQQMDEHDKAVARENAKR